MLFKATYTSSINIMRNTVLILLIAGAYAIDRVTRSDRKTRIAAMR